jgi:8-oxo-dGTP pyrophosphatase MutT (NUDIX family)
MDSLPAPPPNPWTVLSQTRVYETPWIAVDHCDVVTPAGKPGIYGMVRMKKAAVGVLAITAAGMIPLVGQWRPPLHAYSWEMPEGGAEPGEDPAACAGRELEEEAGLVAGRLTEILRMHLSNSVTDEHATVFLATDLTPGRMAPDDTEDLAHQEIHFLQALAMACDGRITDAMTVAALLRAHHMAVTGALDPALAAAMLKPLKEQTHG